MALFQTFVITLVLRIRFMAENCFKKIDAKVIRAVTNETGVINVMKYANDEYAMSWNYYKHKQN